MKITYDTKYDDLILARSEYHNQTKSDDQPKLDAEGWFLAQIENIETDIVLAYKGARVSEVRRKLDEIAKSGNEAKLAAIEAAIE